MQPLPPLLGNAHQVNGDIPPQVLPNARLVERPLQPFVAVGLPEEIVYVVLQRVVLAQGKSSISSWSSGCSTAPATAEATWPSVVTPAAVIRSTSAARAASSSSADCPADSAASG